MIGFNSFSDFDNFNNGFDGGYQPIISPVDNPPYEPPYQTVILVPPVPTSDPVPTYPYPNYPPNDEIDVDDGGFTPPRDPIIGNPYNPPTPPKTTLPKIIVLTSPTPYVPPMNSFAGGNSFGGNTQSLAPMAEEEPGGGYDGTPYNPDTGQTPPIIPFPGDTSAPGEDLPPITGTPNPDGTIILIHEELNPVKQPPRTTTDGTKTTTGTTTGTTTTGTTTATDEDTIFGFPATTVYIVGGVAAGLFLLSQMGGDKK